MIANRLANPRFSSPQVDIHELCKSGALQIYKRLALNKYTSFTAQTSAEKQYDFNTTTTPAAPPPTSMCQIHQQPIKHGRVRWPSKHLLELSMAEAEVMTTERGGYLCLSLHI